MTIAVTGAAGYLGTHMLLGLHDRGENVLAVAQTDDIIPYLRTKMPNIRLPREDADSLADQFRQHDVHHVIHFAGESTITDSLIDPLAAFDQILGSTLTVLKAAKAASVEHFVFSSTASVYGVPQRMPIQEEAPLSPISPFGAAMAMAERMVTDVCRPAAISTAVLRYFNVAGADPKGRAGEGGHPRHLIKAAAQIATGILDESLKIYGDDYETPDGTAIRDYLHVSDMADAHAAAMDYLIRGGRSVILNCGYGEGYSVREVIDAVEKVMGHEMPTTVAPRRAGDPPQLIADNAGIRTTLGWTPRYDDIDLIVRTAIDWERKSRLAI
ncbi:UDP-glucose 4-epimerase GalE [Parvularcula sp. LCG005]|uniref:UDP-glucose 4-epimerase GalE n=1 Tax=Parvularcula sp. LCG005 TaxID=3078805 RepID=UPI0029422C38|nr:UDP-glucose 4-epimerase GalE [Parvularcula sp. LCG005]WOI52723.1 UDP-glucose 4-epimerase GalE [Parvularcula sp. LCG005]